MTLTITNPYTQALTNAGLVDDMSAYDLEFVPGTLSTTCETGGSAASLTLSNNNQTLTLSAGTIPAGVDNGSTVTPGICTITGSVTAPGNSAGGTMWNAIPTNTLTNDQDVSNTTSASDYIYVDPQSIDVYKYFPHTF